MTLEEPFPLEALPLFHQWLRSCPGIARSPEFPQDYREFAAKMRTMLPRVRSWAVKDEGGQIIAAVLLEPSGLMAAQAYVASSRRVWGKGYLDQAVREIMRMVFTGPEPLGCVFGIVKEANRAARNFNLRVGMRLKNIYPASGTSLFELTREQWLEDERERSAAVT